jgi:dihydroorotase
VLPASKTSGEQADIFIKNGKIAAIGHLGTIEGAETIDIQGACVSPGWLDLGTLVGDPGFEHREDFHSVAKAAAAGGFTEIACLPNTFPAIHSKSEVLYVKNSSKGSLVGFLPIGAISLDCKGKDIAEIYDMHAAGAVAFSDGKKPVQDSGLLTRALQYVQPFEGVIINQPLEKSIAPNGQMHEGIVSTSLGLRGIPSLAEELMVQRDIYLAAYTGGRLHLHNISAAGSVKLVKEAKERGLKVTASVAAMNLACDDHLLNEFDSNFKVMPPIREQADFEALRQGLKDGIIDCITSNHTPLDEEAKNVEFPFADFGAIGLETAFALCHTHLRHLLTVEELVDKMAIAPRNILNLPIPEIKEGATANLTIFDPNHDWTFSQNDIYSKSKNTPFTGWHFTGKVLGIVHNYQHFIVKKATGG